MKESIEKKLGCTIEELKMRIDKHMEQFKDCETGCGFFPDTLTYEEIDFLGEYLDKLVAT